MFGRLPFEPYAPVRGQLHCILREVNRRRKLAHYEMVLSSSIRVRRRVVKPSETLAPMLLNEAAYHLQQVSLLSDVCSTSRYRLSG
jgi:hypothetical protein